MSVYPHKSNLRPFANLPRIPLDPERGGLLPLGPTSQTKLFFVVKQISGDYLLVDDGKGERFYVGLPLNMQQTLFEREDEAFSDGLYYQWGVIESTQNSDDEDISWQQTRTVSSQKTQVTTGTKPDGYLWREEKITPPYRLGEPILAVRFTDDKDSDIRWLDLNLAGRSFSYPEVGNTVTYASQSDDTLNCIDSNGNSIFVAKPFMLRKTPWDGAVLDGYTYDYIGTGQRTVSKEATGVEEIQLITPCYQAPSGDFPGEQLVVMAADTGIDGVRYIDLNTAGRCWAVKYEEVSYSV